VVRREDGRCVFWRFDYCTASLVIPLLQLSAHSPLALRHCCYLLNCLLQFLHVDRFGQMRGKTSATAALQVFLHPITADRYALGVADLRQLAHYLKAIAIRKTKIANEKVEWSCAQDHQDLAQRGRREDLVPSVVQA